MTRCAVIVGVSEKSGYIQKSLADFYRFLLSLKGGSWTESEIMIIPEGIDLDSLKFLLRRVSDVKLRSLVFYFCGNKHAVRTENGFIFCGDEIKLQYIEENALHTAVFFDFCGSLVSEDYKDTVQEEFFVQDSDGENDALRNIVADRFLCEDVLEKTNGTAFFCGCKTGEKPLLLEDGSGFYTASFIKSLKKEEELFDVFAADRNARFECELARQNAYEEFSVS
ncbi:hypothetical protein [uncultured Treponema sp.]|uniref:hypothetical protein n=1 Tax=uncultured Treponema sp. TaxID=162155 RepID=UPI002582A455|nr:hypothetical protein [uncultured Treponema sp.]